MRALEEELRVFCRESGQRAPARGTLYSFMAKAPTRRYEQARLPKAVREALYNVDPKASVPGHQLAFYCFNYGDVSAVSFAAGLPWLALFQAARMRGFRPRSRGLLEAVLRARGI
ncbi:MAG: hypothetical protein HYZ28_11360 [Myxococcales bacterium]|nr:hypothetical protein [Myxococcales bacterium]